MKTRTRVGFGLWLGLLGGLAAWLTGAATAQAHDLKEMTINARVHADRIDLVIVLSPHMAGVILAGTEDKVVEINAGTFPALRAELEALGKRLCLLSTGPEPGHELVPGAIDLLLGEENEVDFFLTYPPATDEILRLKAAVLERIQSGYAANLRVLDTKRKLIAAKTLQRGDASITIPLATRAMETSAN